MLEFYHSKSPPRFPRKEEKAALARRMIQRATAATGNEESITPAAAWSRLGNVNKWIADTFARLEASRGQAHVERFMRKHYELPGAEAAYDEALEPLSEGARALCVRDDDVLSAALKVCTPLASPLSCPTLNDSLEFPPNITKSQGTTLYFFFADASLVTSSIDTG